MNAHGKSAAIHGCLFGFGVPFCFWFANLPLDFTHSALPPLTFWAIFALNIYFLSKFLQQLIFLSVDLKAFDLPKSHFDSLISAAIESDSSQIETSHSPELSCWACSKFERNSFDYETVGRVEQYPGFFQRSLGEHCGFVVRGGSSDLDFEVHHILTDKAKSEILELNKASDSRWNAIKNIEIKMIGINSDDSI